MPLAFFVKMTTTVLDSITYFQLQFLSLVYFYTVVEIK